MIRMTEGCYKRLLKDYSGICTACHDIADNIEPDANGYRCIGCGKHTVLGIEWALTVDELEIVDEGLENVDDAGAAPRAKLVSVGRPPGMPSSWKGRKP